MRIGYSYWGFLGDRKLDANGKELSAPDGNATYSWSLIWEMQRRGHTVLAMQEDRDYPAWKMWGTLNFEAFSQMKRTEAYTALKHTFGSSEILPELDVLLVEWRFPIPGRNCEVTQDLHPQTGMPIFSYNPAVHQPDFARQVELLRHYSEKKTKIIIWDLDHKLTEENEKNWKIDAIFETSVTPLKLHKERIRVEPPFIISDLMQHPTLPPDHTRKLVYIGSRYERDDVIDEWIQPASLRYRGEIEFHGKWDDEAKARWPHVKMEKRCTVVDFRRIYGTAGACPLLAKRSYLESGFITPRPWEALLFGTIPIGLSSMKGIEQYVTFIAQDSLDMIDLADTLIDDGVEHRDDMRRANVEKLEFMDARYFVDKIEAVVQTSS